jgi:hypothetical protein
MTQALNLKLEDNIQIQSLYLYPTDLSIPIPVYIIDAR